MKNETDKRICPNGHAYFKSSDCPVCPICESQKTKQSGFLPELSAPAHRALRNAGISNLEELSRFSEKQLMDLHGFGKASIPVISSELAKNGMKLSD